MKKQSLLKVLNPLLLLAFLMVAGAAVGRRLDLVSYESFKEIHPVAGFSFIGFAILHLMLNWSWIRTAYTKRPQGRR